MRLIEEVELKAAAADQEINLLRTSLHQEKGQVQQLHDLLALKEQEHRWACTGSPHCSAGGCSVLAPLQHQPDEQRRAAEPTVGTAVCSRRSLCRDSSQTQVTSLRRGCKLDTALAFLQTQPWVVTVTCADLQGMACSSLPWSRC